VKGQDSGQGPIIIKILQTLQHEYTQSTHVSESGLYANGLQKSGIKSAIRSAIKRRDHIPDPFGGSLQAIELPGFSYSIDSSIEKPDYD
jgi:hypothetical protein